MGICIRAVMEATAFPYFHFILGFTLLEHVFSIYLDWRQHQRFKEDNVPSALNTFIPQDDFNKSQSYNLAKSTFGFLSSNYEFLLDFLALWLGILPMLWNICGEGLHSVGLTGSHEILQSLLFAFIHYYLRSLLTMPVSLYSTFVIEERFGFNKQTLQTFLMDHLKSTTLLIVLGAPILSLLIFIIKWGGDHFWIYVWLFVVVVTVVMLTIYPTLIAPLFNKFTELEEGELRTQIYELASRVNFPLTHLYKVDGSTRSAHSNAYFFGFFKNKRIVLYDTLMEHASTEDIIAIVGHELGHWKLNHTLKNLIISMSHMLIFFYVFGFFLNNDELCRSFGFNTTATIISFTLFSSLYGPIEHVLSLALNYLSRCYEYQADEYATELGFDLTSGLVAIHKKNHSNLNPDPLYSMYHFSHPTLVERIHAIKLTKKNWKRKEKK